jgi:RHS repeat-associated protein
MVDASGGNAPPSSNGSASSQDPASGILPFSTQTAWLDESVDLATSSITVQLPVRRKFGFGYSLVGGSHSYAFARPTATFATWGISTGLGGAWAGSVTAGFSGNSGNSNPCGEIWSGFFVVDPTGGIHKTTNASVSSGYCGYGTSSTGTTTDDTGYTLIVVLVSNAPIDTFTLTYSIYDKSGNKIWTNDSNPNYAEGEFTDPDGNSTTTTWPAAWTATSTDPYSSTPVLTSVQPANIQGSTPGPNTYSYTDAGGTETYSVHYASYSFATNFQCPNLAVSGLPLVDQNGSSELYLPYEVNVPGQGNYTIAYEQTPGYSGSGSYGQYTTGRIAQITYPSGALISYSYGGTNHGINCNSYVVPTLTVTVNYGNGNSGTWRYVNSNNSNTASNFTVTETDPANNQTVYTFSNEFQTQVQYYEGSATGVALKTVVTCYNGDTGNCVPQPYTSQTIARTDVYTSFNGSSSNRVTTAFDSYGDVTSVIAYDFGATTPTTQTFTFYGQTWNGNTSSPACSPYPAGTHIYNTPCYSHTMNSSGDVARTQIAYSPTGHPTSTAKWTGTSWLASTAQYNSNGTLDYAYDVNGTVSTYGYGGGCNNLLATSVAVTGTGLPSVGLTTSTQWDCNGGVATSVTGPNSGQTTRTNYVIGGTADPFYRPLLVVDPFGNSTGFKYSPTTLESAMNFNTSTSDGLTTTDGLGRPIYLQTRQGQGPSITTFDSKQTAYGWGSATGACTTQPPFTMGACITQSMPYSGAAGAAAPSGTAITTTQYDAIGRPYTVVDGGGGKTTYIYRQNDVLVSVTPAPTGENQAGKQRQLEYDGLGRLTSVCEVTTGTSTWPGRNCDQANSMIGYWTRYTYDALGNLQTVTQNAQGTSQTRTYQYDGLSRLTVETNPESGTTTYKYDVIPTSCYQTGTNQSGNLTAKVNADSSFICYYYDGLHRLTDVGNSAQGTTNACRRLRYDNSQGYFGSIPSGVTVNNSLGQLVEAATDSCSTQDSKVTDEWFSYDADGRLTDVYEDTPDSGSYYHTTASYWANGVVSALSGVPSHSGWTFGVDGEGRPNSAQDGSVYLVTANGVAYNAASQPTSVLLGSGDSDSYTYDPNTGRMTKYQFTIGTIPKNLTGTLNWNPNGSLGSLVIVDPFTTADNQTCGYSADDLARLQSVSCGPTSANGATWAQTFAYDPFGNISKSGTSSFLSTYTGTPPTNQYYQIGNNGPGGATHYYDGNGNLTTDLTNTYTWDVYGNMVGVNAITVTYDALDRAVEENNSGTYKEFLYSPIGKLAVMAHQTTSNVFLPLPGGEQALYTNSTINFRHSDWLGSARAESDLTPPLMGDVAYAPFGESYAPNDSPSTSLSFTGANQDTIPGTYDFLFRKYNPVQGRWISPDPSGFSAVDPTNPQSWNRYAYALGNPLGNVDPLGLDCVYLNDDDSVNHIKDGDCGSDTDNGYYFDGTINRNPGAIFVDNNGDALAQVNGGAYQCSGECPVDSVTSYGQLDPLNVGTGPTATISNDPGGKQKFCQEQANKAAAENVLPGVMKGDYTPSGQDKTLEYAGHYALDVAAGSTALKYSIRANTGIPMSIAKNFFEVAGYAAFAYTGYSALKAARDEYKTCMSQ